MQFTWKNNYFTYTCKIPQCVQVHTTNAFQTLQALGFPKLRAWSMSDEFKNHYMAKTWQKAIKVGINAESTRQDIP